MKSIDFSKLETWIHGLVAAVLTGVGIAGSDWAASLVDGQPINWHHLGTIMVVASLGGSFLYLRQSPFPPLGSLTVQGPGTVTVPEGTSATIQTQATQIDTSKPISSTIPPASILK